MIKSLRGRFLLSHLLPILIILPLAWITLLALVETQVLLTDLSQDLTQRAQLIAAITQRDPTIWEDSAAANSLINSLSTEASGDIYFFLADGSLLSSSIDSGNTPTLTTTELRLLQSGEIQQRTEFRINEQEALVILPVETVNAGIIGLVAVGETVSSLGSIIGGLRIIFVVILFIELGLAMIMAIWLSGRMTRPIRQVSQAVMNIASGRDVNPIPDRGPDEIRMLIQAVNILTERLQQLEEIRRRSLANIVHELGRPLGAIRSAIHVLRAGGDRDPAIREELLAGAEAEIERMQPLLDDLAMIHGFVSESGEWVKRLDRQPVDLKDWLTGILIPWRASAIESGLEWETHLAENLPVFLMDAQRMAQVVGNLIDNAIKYSPPGGRVFILADTVYSTESAEILIQVRDNGPGIPPHEQNLVFEPFYRGVRHERYPQGLGLGLNIAREIVIAHGGRLILDSRLGEGSTFSVFLPISPAKLSG